MHNLTIEIKNDIIYKWNINNIMQKENEPSKLGTKLSPETLQALTEASLKASPAANALAASAGFGVLVPQQTTMTPLLNKRLDAANRAVPELTQAEMQFLERHGLTTTGFLMESTELRQKLQDELDQCRREYQALTPPDNLIEQWKTEMPSGPTGNDYLQIKTSEWRNENAPTQLVDRLNTAVADSNLMRGLEKRYSETVHNARSRTFSVLRANP